MTTDRIRWVKSLSFAATIIAVLGLTSLAAMAQNSEHVVLNPGTIIPVTLNSELFRIENGKQRRHIHRDGGYNSRCLQPYIAGCHNRWLREVRQYADGRSARYA